MREFLRGDGVYRMVCKISSAESPEERLLCAVLATAVVDALGKETDKRMSARDYFNRGGHQWLCEVLGIDVRVPRNWIASFEAAEAVERARK